jgi:hypothetical protein
MSKMVEKKNKRSPTTPPKRKVKKQRTYTDVPELTEISFSPLEEMVIELHTRKKLIADLKLADVYGFLKFSTSLPELNIELVNQFLMNYNINDGSSVVEGRRIVIDQELLSKSLYLPTSEIGVGDARAPTDFNPGQYFKTGMEALDARQGWKIGEAITPDLMDWMRIAQKRLVLGVHGTYLAQKYLYAVTQSFNGMVFNWAAFVVERIHQELEYKRRKGRIGTLLAASYISIAIQYQLKQPLTESDRELEEERNATVKEGEPKRKDDVQPSVPNPPNRTRLQQRVNQDKVVPTEVSSPSLRWK